MPKTALRFHIALFIVTFVVFLFIERHEFSSQTSPASALQNLNLANLIPARVSQIPAQLQGNGAAKVEAATPGLAQPASQSPEAIEAAQELQRLSTEALTTTDSDARAAAVQQLSGTRTPETLYALSQIALHDHETRIRYMAVESLRLLAFNQGDADGSVRTLLRIAANDRDAEIARHASDSLRDLAELLDPK